MSEQIWLGRQGDVLLIGVPESWGSLSPDARRIDDTSVPGIILAHGEATGHHHSIVARTMNPPQFRDTYEHGGNFGGVVDVNTGAAEERAALFRDRYLETQLLRRGLIKDTRNAIGFLQVTAPVTLDHQEHGSLNLEPGRLYYVARQRSFEPRDAELVGTYVAD